jgi:4-carboxymuconolactone decarboxylase
MPRLTDLDLAKMSPEQRAVYDRIIRGPRGRVEGPLGVWLTSPELADKAQALGAFCRFGTSLPPRLSELAILVTGAHWQAGFEWYAHAPLAIKAGLSATAVESIRTGDKPKFDKADESAVFIFSHELVTQRKVSTATYAEAVRQLTETRVVELVAILGYYALVSMTLTVFEIPLPPGEKDPFATMK